MNNTAKSNPSKSTNKSWRTGQNRVFWPKDDFIDGNDPDNPDNWRLGNIGSNNQQLRTNTARINGTNQNDVISGTSNSDWIKAFAGNDKVEAGGGNDTLLGDSGNDSLYGERDDDLIILGAGNDRGFGGRGNDTIRGGAGDDILIGGVSLSSIGDGRDLLFGDSGNDALVGGLNHDTLIGGSGDDRLQGDSGTDRLVGGDGSDTLVGGIENDTLVGGAGADLLRGDQGIDVMRGGTGQDIFYLISPDSRFGPDRILDFKTTDDFIAVSAGNYGGGLQQQVGGFLNNSQLTLGSRATHASHRFIFDANRSALFYDADGVGGASQMRIATLRNVTTLDADNIFVGS